MKVTVKDDKVIVESDYSSEFVKGARKLNGKWIGSAWSFDARNEDRVRKLLLEVYGEDGTGKKADTVTVQLDLSKFENNHVGSYIREVELFGRVLVRRPGRDRDVMLHKSVIIVEGGFPGSGGSMNNPRLNTEEGTVLEVKDVPVKLYEKALAEYPDCITLVDKDDDYKKALLAEKQQLLDRLKEIEELLK